MEKPEEKSAMHSSHIVSVGHEKLHAISSEHHGSHTEHVLTLLVNGELKMKHRETFTIKPGMVTLVPAGMPHSLLSGENIEVWWLSFCSSCLSVDENHSLMAPFKQVRQGKLPTLKLSKDRQKFFNTLLSEIKNATETANDDSWEVIRSLLLLILNEINKASPLDTSIQANSSLLSECLEFIQNNSLTPISLKDVAASVHRTPAYVATIVKTETGYSVGDWITRNRLTEACSRLLHTNDNIETIGYQIGWGDVTHFIRQFKKAYGDSPASWRKQNRQKSR